MKKGIAVFGSTGSIGRQTLEVISKFPNNFNIVALATKGNLSLFKKQIKKYNPAEVCISNGIESLASSRKFIPKIFSGEEGLIKLAQNPKIDILVMAIVGTAGLNATLAAIKLGKTIALASKEILIAAGDIVMAEARKHNAQILPLDSEHSAVMQCLGARGKGIGYRVKGRDAGIKDKKFGQTIPYTLYPSPFTLHPLPISRIILTASGGPFRNFTKEQLSKVTAKQALQHPTWNMGPKITIDSATLMNKGLEVIEAHHLFGVNYDKIEVVIHPQSIIHSMVEFVDGSIIAQLGIPDMRTPIQYALNYPERANNSFGNVDFNKIKKFTFEKPDLEKLPCLALAYKAGKIGGTMPAVLSASNDSAVQLFLDGKIKFTEIPEIVKETMNKHKTIKNPMLEQILETEKWARNYSFRVKS